MTKQYQRKTAPASETLPAVPAQVSVALGEIAGDLQEGLLALAVGAAGPAGTPGEHPPLLVGENDLIRAAEVVPVLVEVEVAVPRLTPVGVGRPPRQPNRTGDRDQAVSEEDRAGQ
ncbi:MAG: hypothetical protein M3P70_03600 [Actinomycetota bacterium]|nr:hypothetical protein [Actinomycetota bacterium]